MPQQISPRWKRWQALARPDVEWRVFPAIHDATTYSVLAVPPDSEEWYRANGFVDDWNAEDELSRSFVITRLSDAYPFEMAQIIANAHLLVDPDVHHRYLVSPTLSALSQDTQSRQSAIYAKHPLIYNLLSRYHTPAAIWAELNASLQYSLRDVMNAIRELCAAGLIEKESA